MKLLERAASLQELEAALQAVVGGNGRIVLISGEAGIGKTSLVETFTDKLQESVRVLWGICDAVLTPRPLSPLYDMAAQTSGNLAQLLNTDTNRAAIFAALLNEIRQRPTVALFEDVHWADETTLDLLRFVGRRIATTTALLVLTYRDDELNLQHPLRTLLGDLVTSATTHRLSLPPLTETAVRDLVGERDLDAAVLHQQTGGNPFFVTEVLADHGDSLPPTIRDAVLARAARLSRPAQAVLQAAAVIGSRIEPWLLAAVTDAEVWAADECLTSGMLQDQGEMLVFRHELARQTVLDAIPLHQRTGLHRRVLKALQASPTEQSDLARLAHHAGAARDRQAVLAYAPVAAKQAASGGVHRGAVALYSLTLEFADDLPLDQQALLLEAYAQQCDLVGQQAEGIAARNKALAIWRKLDNPRKQGENLAYMMNMHSRLGQNDEAQRVSREAVEILEPLPPGPELALAYRVQAQSCLVNRDYREALSWAEKAHDLAERFEDAEVLSAVHITIGTARLFLNYERGCTYLEDKLAFARQARLNARVAHIYTNLGSGSGELYHFQRALSYLEAGIAYAIEHDLDSFRLYMLAWHAFSYCHLGRWREAIDIAASVLQSPGVTVISRITALVVLGRVRTRRGDSNGQVALDEALELANRTHTIQRLGLVRAARAEAAWHAGDSQQMLAEVSAVYELAASKRHPWFAGELAFWRWQSGETVSLPSWMAEPFTKQINGDWRGAARAWAQLDCPYEQARALSDGDAEAQVEALAIFEQLGATPMAESVRQKLRDSGVQAVPRGPRPTTRTNPFGLTNRQVEVLTLLTENLTNAQIAARLYISPKTVDHHVSAVLARLDVHSREEAADLAREHPHFNP